LEDGGTKCWWRASSRRVNYFYQLPSGLERSGANDFTKLE